MIGIIDYEAGNIASVTNALNRLNVDLAVTNDTDKLEQCDGYIFPGVGHASSAMSSLDEHNLIGWLKGIKKPLLGICLGMQLLFEESEEGDSPGIGVIPGRLRKFDSKQGKVPHMGWNTFSDITDHTLLNGIHKDDYFYYVHSYYAPVNQYTLATCDYISIFASVVANNNFLGVQFHPEKSGSAGERLLSNFLSIVRDSTSVTA